MVSTTRITVKFPNEEVAQLEQIAKEGNTNRHALIRKIVRTALECGDFSVPEQVKTPGTG